VEPGRGYYRLERCGRGRVRLNTTGLGVGITPAVKLHVAGSAATGRVRVQSTDGSGVVADFTANGAVSGQIGTIGNLPFNIHTNSIERIFITGAGLVGIGRASTANELDVVGAAGGTRLALDTTADGVGAGGTILFYKFGTLRGSLGVRANRYGDNSGEILTHATSQFTINTGAGVGTEAIRIDASQNVLVQTVGAVFNAAGRGVVEINGSSSSLVGFQIAGAQGGYLFHSGTDLSLVNVKNNNLILGTNAAGVVTISGTKVGINTGGTIGASGLEVLGASNTLILRGGAAGGYQGVRIYNDQNSSVRSLEMDYCGSTFAGAFMTNGPTGEQAAITTTGAFPLVFGAGNAAKVVISSATGTPMYQVLNGGAYNCIVDAGGTAASMPIGCLVAGQRSGAGTNVANLQTFVASGANFFQMANADGSTTNVQTGTWRVLGQISGTFCIFTKIA
jgi:hypothetical protein